MGSLQDYAVQEAQSYGIPENLFLGQIGAESSWNPGAVDPSGTYGIAQVTEATAQNPGFGVTPLTSNDPESQIAFAAQYDSALYNEFGNWGTALAAYNQGPGAVASNGVNYSALSPQYQSLYDQGNALSNGVTTTQLPGTNIGGLSTGEPTEYAAPYGATGDPVQDMSNPSCWDSSDTYLCGQPGSGTVKGPAGSVTAAASGLLVSAESWLGNGALNVAVVVIGVIFLAAGLFLLGGGKPRDVISLAAE